MANNNLPHNSRRKRVIRRPSDRLTVRVGDFYASAAQVRAELDRIETRMLALKRDIARNVAADNPLRQSFADFFDGWYAFQRDARQDWLAWGTNVTQAQYFDQELDRYRSRYSELTGLQPTAPTTSRTANRSLFSGMGGTLALVAGGAVLALGLAYMASD